MQVNCSAEEEETTFPVRDNPQGKEVGDIFYLIESPPQNPWAAIGVVGLAFCPHPGALSFRCIARIHCPRGKADDAVLTAARSAAGSNATKLQAPRVASAYTPTSTGITAPVHKTKEAPPPPAGATSGGLEGVPGGVVGGVSSGVSSEMLNSAPSVPVLAKSPAPMPAKRMRIASRVAEANLIHDVAPQYPSEAGRARIEGTVVLMALIGKDGSVHDVQVESGLPILAQAAIDAVRQWRYRPYVIDGEPVEVDSRITINFTLSAS